MSEGLLGGILGEEDKKPNVEATETPASARGSRLTAERLWEKRKESMR